MINKALSYKGISLFIKLLIASTSLYYIYYKVFIGHDSGKILNELVKIFENVSSLDVFSLFMLMFLNWSLESLKWNWIIKHIEPISFLKSFKAVLTGLTVSIFTPNRVGEFGGRIFFLLKENRVQGILLTFLGNASQLLVTILMGAIALLFYLPGYTDINRQQAPYIYFTFVIIVLLMLVALPLAYFNVSLLNSFVKKIKLLNKVQHYLEALNEYSITELTKILLLSFFRYVVFTVQFYLLLKLYGVELSFKEGFIMIALTFFAITAIPTYTVTELGVRGSAALAFIGLLSNNSTGIITASFALWIINIAIPAIAGSVFVFQLNFFKTKL